MYIIRSFGYDGGPVFSTLTEARKALANMKREDRRDCRRKFGIATVKNGKDSYSVEAGINLWSASAIQKY